MKGESIPRQEAEGVVLTRAALRASEIGGLTQKELAAIIGLSPATLSRLSSGTTRLRPGSKEGELAILFVRIFRSLDSLVGGEPASIRAWLHAYNHHLHGVPLELMQSVRGMVDVAAYLDAIRGKA